MYTVNAYHCSTGLFTGAMARNALLLNEKSLIHMVSFLLFDVKNVQAKLSIRQWSPRPRHGARERRPAAHCSIAAINIGRPVQLQQQQLQQQQCG